MFGFFCVAVFSFRRYTVSALFWGWMTLQLIVFIVDGFWNYFLFGRLFVLRKERVSFFRICEWYDYTTTMVHGSEILWLHRLIYETWWNKWGRFSILWDPSAKTTSFLGVSKRFLEMVFSKTQNPAGRQGFGSAPKRLETPESCGWEQGTWFDSRCTSSAEVTPKGSKLEGNWDPWVQGNLGWWNIII